ATVVGVSGDVRQYGLDRETLPQLFVPLAQSGGVAGRFLVRTEGDPLGIAQMIRTDIHAVDPDMPIKNVRTLAELRSQSLATPKLTALLLTGVAAGSDQGQTPSSRARGLPGRPTMAGMGRHLIAAALFAVAVQMQAPPAESSGTAAAKGAFEAARTAERAGDKTAAVALYRKAIGLDPRYVDAHEQFISLTESIALAYGPA